MAEEANTQEVIETNPEEGNQDELDSILEALSKDESVVEDKTETPSEDKKDDEPFKKVGNLVFKTEADYDAWALKNNGEVSRLTGELKKAQELAKTNPSKETVADVNAIRMQIKVADFFEANPDAVEYKSVIAALLRSGKASNLEDAKIKAMRAVGVEPEKKSETEDVKNILKAGGTDSVGSGSYNKQEDVDGISSFADSALLGKL